MSKCLKWYLASALFAGFQVSFAAATLLGNGLGNEAGTQETAKNAVALIMPLAPETACEPFAHFLCNALKDCGLRRHLQKTSLLTMVTKS